MQTVNLCEILKSRSIMLINTSKTATSMTMNSPDSLLAIHAAVTQSESLEDTVEMAELIREVGLKCISFNGVKLASKLCFGFY